MPDYMKCSSDRMAKRMDGMPGGQIGQKVVRSVSGVVYSILDI